MIYKIIVRENVLHFLRQMFDIILFILHDLEKV